MNIDNDKVAATAKFIGKNFLSTAKNTDSNKDNKAGNDDGHPLMPADNDTRRKVHSALGSVHRAVFHNKDHDTLEKAKKAHKLLVDAAKPDDKDTDDEKPGKNARR